MHMPPPVHGAAMMGKYIHDSKLINESFECHYINLTTAKNLEDIGHLRLGKVFDFLHLLQHIWKAVKAIRPDLVYITPNAKAPAFYKDYIVVQLIKQTGCKVILHYHNKGVATRQNLWGDNQLYKRFFKGVKVILLADALYPDMQKYVKREDVYICPNGIPDATDGKEPTAERHNKIPHILFLSNLLICKGVLVLLDALKILKDKGYSFICDFVGGETDDLNAKSFSEEVKKRGLNEIAIYHGKKYGKEKESMFANADIFTLPSLNEAFPLVNIEAMQNKLPIVSTNVGGIEDEVENGENGFITKAGSSQMLAQALGALIDDKELRQKMGEKGYEKYKELFTKDKFESNIKAVLSDCMGGVVLTNYFGKRYGEDKTPFLKNADIFCFPTFYPNECFPLVLLEAMQHGIACISTNEGGIPHIIDEGKNGFMVPKQDPIALADAISRLITDRELCRKMGEFGLEKYQNEFTLDKFEERFVGILKSELCNTEN